MKMRNPGFLLGMAIMTVTACGKGSTPAPPPNPPTPAANFSISTWEVNGAAGSTIYRGVNVIPAIKLVFPKAIDRNTVTTSISFNNGNYSVAYQNGDSVLVLQPTTPLSFLAKYDVTAATTLKSKQGGILFTPASFTIQTRIDSSRKFPALTDAQLMDKVQEQTFKYFWDYGHPVSGLARERSNATPETVTSGGSGFGVMAIITGVHRNFITRQQGLARLQTTVSFLKNTAQKFHGAFPHWLNGTTGAVIPFSTKDNGADLVETSYLIQGLLCARQYFNSADAAEATLRSDINSIANAVEWNWFRQNNQNVLYWHWSFNYNWEMNHQIKGWNECLITYVLAASSANYSIPKTVYDNGWATNGGMKNGNAYYG
ncbi:MAG: glucoamylase family protein, partial [Bacteroidota bacterium]